MGRCDYSTYTEYMQNKRFPASQVKSVRIFLVCVPKISSQEVHNFRLFIKYFLPQITVHLGKSAWVFATKCTYAFMYIYLGFIEAKLTSHLKFRQRRVGRRHPSPTPEAKIQYIQYMQARCPSPALVRTKEYIRYRIQPKTSKLYARKTV